jgi:chitosanase
MPNLLTATQKATAQAIVNVFETSSVRGDYGKVTLIPGDSGHLTFGRSQTTLGSGNLAALIAAYCDTPGARFASWLARYRQPMSDRDVALDDDARLHNLLRASADDVVMRDVQDRFFDETYWQPAETFAIDLGFVQPLSMAVVYDSVVHGSWARIRDRTTAIAGSPAQAGEQRWTRQYVDVRRAWLAASPRDDLRPTVYRMDAFIRMIALDLWDLALPIVVRGAEVSDATLAQTPPRCYAGPAPGSRALALQTPLQAGLDARLLQLALSERGIDVIADGLFGRASMRATRAYQAAAGVTPTGIADVALIAELTAPFQ